MVPRAGSGEPPRQVPQAASTAGGTTTPGRCVFRARMRNTCPVTVPEDPLVSVPALADRLAGVAPPTLLDVRWRLAGPPGRADYLAGHLPGAVFVDLDSDLCGPARESVVEGKGVDL